MMRTMGIFQKIRWFFSGKQGRFAIRNPVPAFPATQGFTGLKTRPEMMDR